MLPPAWRTHILKKARNEWSSEAFSARICRAVHHIMSHFTLKELFANPRTFNMPWEASANALPIISKFIDS